MEDSVIPKLSFLSPLFEHCVYTYTHKLSSLISQHTSSMCDGEGWRYTQYLYPLLLPQLLDSMLEKHYSHSNMSSPACSLALNPFCLHRWGALAHVVLQRTLDEETMRVFRIPLDCPSSSRTINLTLSLPLSISPLTICVLDLRQKATANHAWSKPWWTTNYVRHFVPTPLLDLKEREESSMSACASWIKSPLPSFNGCYLCPLLRDMS